MSTFTWLHLSDLHLRSAQSYDANIVLAALLRDAAERVQAGLRPDWIVVTGDVAFSGQPDEYAMARPFFDELLRVCGLPRERLFVVPGNHDVDRRLVTTGAKAIGAGLTDRNSANEVLNTPDDRRLLMRRFEGYAAFVNDYLPHLGFDDEHYFYVRTINAGGKKVALLGLNSAWLCTSDRDKADGLLIGERQARAALEQAQGADLKIALLHHPFDWLREFDQDDSAALLTGGCDFILHGHLHRTAATQLVSPDAAAMILAGGACYETRDRLNVLNWVQLDPAAGQGMLYLRRYSDKQGGFWASDTLTYKNAADGTFAFALRGAAPAQRAEKTPSPAPPVDDKALKTYFDVVLKEHSKLSFWFIQPKTGKVYTEADVESVFVPLRMSDPDAVARQARLASRLERMDRPVGEAEARPITLSQALAKYPCFLLRGHPGCGKTTLLRHVALCFARGEHKTRLAWQGPDLLPLLVSLRNFGAFLKNRPNLCIEPQPRALLDYLHYYLEGRGVRFSPGFLEQRLEQGECFLLLDALDEASGTLEGGDLRTEVARQVSAFIQHYDKNRFGLSSRPRAYEDDGPMRRALPQPKICDVFPLDADGYRRLILNLMGVLADDPTTGRTEADDLVKRIAPNPHLSSLAGNPLMCTTLVLVYKYHGRQLPERRVDVLDEIVTLLLGRWEQEKRHVYRPEELAAWGAPASSPDEAIEFRRRALRTLAWQMQQDHAPEMRAEAAIETLTGFYCGERRAQLDTARAWAADFLDAAHERSGLFLAVDKDVHAFAHQAFREYLAATHLVNAGEASLAQEILAHAPRPDDWWEQALLLAAAHPRLPDDAAGRLIDKLLEQAVARGADYAHLAARCAHDMMGKLPDAQRKRLQDWLEKAMQDGSRPAPERAQCGRALALAGDPRPGVGLSPLPLGEGQGVRAWPDIQWADIPGGELMLGSRKGETFKTPKGTEKPRDNEYWHGKPIPIQIKPFKLAAYPITVAQFRPFVQDPKGWANDDLWTAAGRADRGGQKAPYLWDDPKWCIDNHPVVGVTWYAAVAYCRWLTDRLRNSGDPRYRNALVRLPTEAEWEWAARGPLPSPSGRGGGGEGKRWPWGDEWEPGFCNSEESGIGRTSAVGMFSSGVNWSGGVYDLAGNVWEWCSTKWQSAYDKNHPAVWGLDEWTPDYLEGSDGRVLRGGSWAWDAHSARGAFRWLHPELGVTLTGMRCGLWL